MLYVKADTSVKVVIGPFLDVGDGFTPETGVTLTGGGDNADEAELLKHDNATTVDISGNTWAALSGVDGYYHLTLTSGNTDTEGQLSIIVQNDSVHLPVRCDFMVVNANVFDSLFAAAATDYLQVDTVQISSDTTAADNLEESATSIVTGQASAGTLSTTQMTTNLSEATDNHYIGRLIIWTSGVLLGQATNITDYAGSGGLLTFEEVTEAPSASDTFVIL